jgi:baseplate J-like protein
VTISFTFTTPPGGVNTTNNPKLQWEAWDGVHATSLGTTTASGTVTGGLTDSTKAFSQASGAVTFTLPAAIPRSTVGAVTSRWIRVRLIAGDYGHDLVITSPGGVLTVDPANFAPPSIASMTLTWQGATAAQPLALVVRQTAQTYTSFRGAAAAGSLAIFLAAPELEFQGAIETRSSLQLGFDAAFEPVLTTLYLGVLAPPSPDPAQFGTAPVPRDPPQLAWEYWNGSGWQALDVEDGTLNLSRSGLVRFEPPADAAPLTQFGSNLFWLRARALDLTFSPMPRVGRAMVNTVWASNARTSTREVIGSSSGARDQQFTLAGKPVLDGQRIEVGESEAPPAAELAVLQASEGIPGGDDVVTPDPVAGVTWVRWHEVPDFHASGPRDRHYTFDAETGTVNFGDGAAGMIPPTGGQNVRAAIYRAGGGTAGNVAAGAINRLQTTVALVDGVSNPEPAVGGAPIEPVAGLLDRAARELRHGGRAVTAQDFSDLALESSRAIARAVAITPSFSPVGQASGPLTGPADLGRDGQVIVVIVPAQVQPGASPSSDLCAEVEDYLRARCAPDARVMVIGPSWVATDVAVEIAATGLEQTDAVIAAARAAVLELLDPLTGGDGGTGWDFGRCPRASDFVARIAAIPDIDHVSSITVTCDPAFKDTDPQAEILIDELSLYPRLLAYARTITVIAQPQGAP